MYNVPGTSIRVHNVTTCTLYNVFLSTTLYKVMYMYT